jgi:16S rRNA (cytidine1402-2'-O)-methyltransferase
MEGGPNETSEPAEKAHEGSERAGPSKRGLPPGLFIVATPIGNAGDITLRALEILRGVDLIACEDTRVSAKLLTIHDVQTRRLAYHDHNAEHVRPLLLARLNAGERVALISDAGTPLVSDPGFKLVRAAVAAGVPVHAAPGASALLTALVLSGLPSDRFLFAGFLDAKSAARRRELAELAGLRATLVFYESAQRLARSLADMAETLGDRPAAVARELTKLHETVARGSLAELATDPALAAPKGEVVVVIGPPAEEAATAEDAEAALAEALTRLSPADAAREVAGATGLARRDLYRRALALKAS